MEEKQQLSLLVSQLGIYTETLCKEEVWSLVQVANLYKKSKK